MLSGTQWLPENLARTFFVISVFDPCISQGGFLDRFLGYKMSTYTSKYSMCLFFWLFSYGMYWHWMVVTGRELIWWFFKETLRYVYLGCDLYPSSRWSGDVIRRIGMKNFNAVFHNRARPFFFNSTWQRRG